MPKQTYWTPRRTLPLGRRTYIVGILNLTPDSFSDGGQYASDDLAVQHFHAMVKAGATMIDVGGESTRPGYVPVTADEEMARVVPLIEAVRSQTDVLISVDTSKAEVADAALAAGADIVNDVWGAQKDPDMVDVIARNEAPCILMHNRPAEEAGTGDVMESIIRFLKKSVALVCEAGLRKDAICLDPGLGFGKTYEENWEVIRRLPELKALGYPVLLGASRKSMIAKLLDLPDPADRLSGTLATTALGIQAGVDFIRVHDVLENSQCAKVMDHCLRYDQRD
ncbi:dihydropteroate synthase [Coraliomargarita parva]|uniref:dihydropteroate synthase n=1 Tax=Coraliomargarita parva TaxID=3014050 RepID=UPI0022B4E1F2|nr:dihydropteroate synthase [Coraliomargarita parva]